MFCLLDCQFEVDLTICIAIPLRATKSSQVLIRVEDAGVSYQKVTPEQAAEAVRMLIIDNWDDMHPDAYELV
jgi:hypothetical protein